MAGRRLTEMRAAPSSVLKTKAVSGCGGWAGTATVVMSMPPPLPSLLQHQTVS